MKLGHRYFPIDGRQREWGLFATCAGSARSAPGAEFPSRQHPDEYYFTWERGRTLGEWQLILVAHGRGEVEFRDRRMKLAPGALIVLPQGAWHRYRPEAATGWQTLWLGFGGELAGRLMGCAAIRDDGDVLDMAKSRHLRDLFAATVDGILEEGNAGAYSASARVFSFIAALAEFPAVGKDASKSRREEAVRRAKAFIAEHCGGVVDFKALAKSLGMTYRTFRHSFAMECGVPPLRFQLETKLARATHLLASSDMPVSEIASSLGFGSTWHFSHFFQRETGRSATEYRKQAALRGSEAQVALRERRRGSAGAMV